MRRTTPISLTLVFVIAVAFATSPPRGDDAKLKLEDVLARHLQSIGAPEARASIKTRVVEAQADMREVVGGSRTLQGSAALFSEGHKLKVAMQFPGSPQYPGEQWVFDGRKALVALTSAGARSALGDFLFKYPEIMREGLLGGTLFTAWPLLELPGRQGKLSYQGLKKVSGRDLHQLTYVPKAGGSAMEIRLYFEPESFRHVKTVYRLTIAPGMGADLTQHLDETRYTLEENFSDFQTVDGLTLPAKWNIRYEVHPSRTAMMEWNITVQRITHNAAL